MGWELKASAWDFSELGREDDTRPAALVGSSSLGVPKNGGRFSVDLKLGGLGDMGEGSVDKLQEPRGSTIDSLPSGSSKRTRAINGTQNVSCLVDRCTADLSNCKEYHRRHRVCERHSKTPVVFVGGKEQRFCQQCSRFQSLWEFDEEKRSCRKRLDGHNRRRRKPQPEAFYMSSGTFLPSYRGLLQFGSLQTCTTPAADVVPSWPRVAKYHQDLHVTDQQGTIRNSLACMYNGGDKRFPFLLAKANNPERSNQAVPDVSICQQLVNNGASPERVGGHQKILSDGLTQSVNSKRAHSLLSSHGASPERVRAHQKILSDGFTQSVNSKRAHSLLSSHPTQTSEASFSHLFQGDVIHPNRPRGTALHFDGLVQYPCLQGVDEKRPVLVPHASNTNNICNEIFQVPPDDLWERGPHKHLHFPGSS